jgi:hypothetical protein
MGHTGDADELLEVTSDELRSVVGDDAGFGLRVLGDNVGALQDAGERAAFGPGDAERQNSLFGDDSHQRVAQESASDRDQLEGERLTAQLNTPLTRDEQLKKLKRSKDKPQQSLFEAHEEAPQRSLFGSEAAGLPAVPSMAARSAETPADSFLQDLKKRIGITSKELDALEHSAKSGPAGVLQPRLDRILQARSHLADNDPIKARRIVESQEDAWANSVLGPVDISKAEIEKLKKPGARAGYRIVLTVQQAKARTANRYRLGSAIALMR